MTGFSNKARIVFIEAPVHCMHPILLEPQMISTDMSSLSLLEPQIISTDTPSLSSAPDEKNC